METMPTFQIVRKDLFGKKAATQGTVWLQAQSAESQPYVCIKPQTLSRYFGKKLNAQECRSLSLANQKVLNDVIGSIQPSRRAQPQGKRMVAEVTLSDLQSAAVKLSDSVLTNEWPYMF